MLVAAGSAGFAGFEFPKRRVMEKEGIGPMR